MAIQTVVNNDPGVAYEGLLAEGGPRDIISKKAQVAIFAGRLVVQGTADDQCKYPVVTGDVTGKPFGIAGYDASLSPAWPPGGTGEQYPIGAGVSIIRKGRVWVKVEEAVVPFGPVFVRFAAGSFALLGAFRTSADTATAVQLPSATYLTTAGIGGFAIVEINLP